MPLPAGTRLGPYEIVAAIGAGGMGEVYKAHDPRLNRHVAIKVLGANAVAPDALERFEQEARAASKLNHPNILTVHDVGREGGVVYFAMEWVDDRTLRELLRAGRLPMRRALEIAQQVAEGLAKAHAAGVVHRDLTIPRCRPRTSRWAACTPGWGARRRGGCRSCGRSSSTRATPAA